MKRRLIFPLAAVLLLAGTILGGYFGIKRGFPRPYADVVVGSGLDPLLVYSVMKAESGFDEHAVSSAGAVGLMQLRPSTAEFICRMAGEPFDAARLAEGAYNVELGCRYLLYLTERFPVRDTALAAYNAGEGRVAEWLSCREYSPDGRTLKKIPYPETRAYLKKIKKFLKFYRFYYP